jgi:hypothetical protein
MSVFSRLESRLNKITSVTSFDIDAWIEEATTESEIEEVDNENAVFYLALAIAYETMTGNVAHYFKYADGEESVDKTNIYENYLNLAKDARKNYRKHARGRFGASQIHSSRSDNR